MLSEVKEPLLDLDNCSLHELISILQKVANDPSINVNQAGFGSYIANHVLKEKIARYNQEAMIPPKLGDVWIPKVLVTIGKETHHAILDLGSSVSVLSKELYEVLELKNLEKCSVEFALADNTIKHALGKGGSKLFRNICKTKNLYAPIFLQNFFFFVFRLCNSKFHPTRATRIPLHDHLTKPFINTSILINGAGLLLKSLKLFQPNQLKKK